MNKVTLVGLLGKDAQMVVQKDNFSVSIMSVATKDRIKKDDQWITITDWHKVKIINRQNLIPHLLKGSLVAVTGKMKTEKYTKDGVDIYSVFVEAEDIELLNKPKSNDQGSNQPQESDQPQFDHHNDDIPF